MTAIYQYSPGTDVIVVSEGVGEGVGADWLTTESATRGLANVRVLPFQSEVKRDRIDHLHQAIPSSVQSPTTG